MFSGTSEAIVVWFWDSQVVAIEHAASTVRDAVQQTTPSTEEPLPVTLGEPKAVASVSGAITSQPATHDTIAAGIEWHSSGEVASEFRGCNQW